MDVATSVERETRVRRRWRIVRNVAIAVVALPLLLWLILFVTKGRFLKAPFESVTGALTGREIRVQGDFQLYFAPLRIKLLAEGLTISNPAWASRPHLFSAGRIDARIAPLSLIWGKRRFYWLDLRNGRVDLEWNASRTANSWTFGDKKQGKPLEFPRIDVAAISGTTLRYLDPRMRLLADLQVDDIRSSDARIGRAVGVRGGGKLRDTRFRVAARLLSPDATANRGENKLIARAWAANNIIDVAGTLPSIAEIEEVPLRTRARGRNLSELLGIIGVALPNTRRYQLTSQLVKSGETYRFTDLAGTFGNSDVAGRLTITNGDRLHLDSAIATKRLDIIDAAPFIGYNPDIVASMGAQAAAAATGAGARRILPDAEFPVATMQRFDADLKWTIGAVRSRNLPISNIDLTLDLDRGKLRLSPLRFAMARGDVASDLIFDTRRRPAAVSYDVRLTPTPLGRLLAGYGVAEAGTTGTMRGRIRLTGRGDTIHDTLATANGRIAFIIPQGALWTRNVQLSELDIGTFVQKMFEQRLKEPVQINCGLVAFTVRGGLAAADPILIDTRKNVILGHGGFSFQTEALDLAFRADSKKFSLFAGQSPVGVKGRFAEPALQVLSPELAGRAGAALGLALVATPVASLLSFIDPGDAKSAACGPVLAGATAQAQRSTKGQARDDVGNGSSPKPKQTRRKKVLGIF